MEISSIIASLSMGQFVFMAIAGAFMILSSLYLLSKGYVIPFGVVLVVAFLVWLSWIRIQPAVTSQPPVPDESPSQFDVFREMESADQTRVNPWVGFLQEDVYANRSGPIGTFVGNDDYVKNAPLYPFKGMGGVNASDIESCKLLERDLTQIPASNRMALETQCQADLNAATTS